MEKHIINKTIVLVCLLSMAMVSCKQDDINPVVNHDPSEPVTFSRGADISWCTEMENDGWVSRNKSGKVTDIFSLMKEIGMTAVRLRVWVNPYRYGYGRWCDKADVISKAKRAKEQGLDILIDFHYSDFFADPGTQNIPLDWSTLDAASLKTAMTNHTKAILKALKAEDIFPRWVQVGNETNSGMLFPAGKIDWDKTGNARYTNYIEFSNAGYDSVKSVFPNAEVIIHLGGAENAGWFFQEFKAAGGKFDMIGLSHYPTADEWDSTSDNATHSNVNAAKWIQEAGQAYGVPVMVVETGFDVHQPELSSRIMSDLFTRLTAVSECKGIFYWEPEVDGTWKPKYYNTLGWGAYGMGAFTSDGRPTMALDAFSR